VVTITVEDIIAYNADTGGLLWSYPQKSQFDVHPNTPVYSDGMVFTSVGGGGGSKLFRLTDGGKSAELAWENELDVQLGGAVKVGDFIYAAGQTGREWFCVDWKTGETKYKVREIAPCNVIFADEMLYCYSETGKVYLVRPNPDKLEIISSFELTLGTNQHWAHPVIYNGVLYIRHGDALMAYKVK
jgi:outer membrane protein assembly factor BamB